MACGAVPDQTPAKLPGATSAFIINVPTTCSAANSVSAMPTKLSFAPNLKAFCVLLTIFCTPEASLDSSLANHAPLDLLECSFRGTFSITSRQAAARGPDAAQDTSHDAARDTQGSGDDMARRVDDPTHALPHHRHISKSSPDAVHHSPGPIRDTTDGRPRSLVNAIDDVARAVAQTLGDVRGLPLRHAVEDT